MIFSSVSFLFFLLPMVVACTFLASARYRNHILFAGSLIFYFWGEGMFTLLLLGSVAVNYFLARAIENSIGRQCKLLLTLGVCCNLLPLFILKYLGFIVESLQPIFLALGFQPWHGAPLHLPAGISFFTFQAISYLVDVFRRIVPAEQKILNCGLYISMFPQLIAGPIVRYHDIAEQLVRRVITAGGFARGAERFVFGLGKKVLIADQLGIRADYIFQLPINELSTGDAWLGAICFSLQIYYDFSGYSDMAIGLGRMFGFRLPENFMYPYISRSLREFWRRWHISLSTWLRDYLYFPLGGSHGSTKRTLFNLLIIFLLCGLWHGANWTFIIWGLWHGLFLVVERLIPLRQNTIIHKGAGWLYTTAVVIIGWVIFRSISMDTARQYLLVMAGIMGTGSNLFFTTLLADSKLMTELIAGCILAFPVYGWLRQGGGHLAGHLAPVTSAYGMEVVFGCSRLMLFGTVLYFAVITIAAQAYQPFLYFQF